MRQEKSRIARVNDSVIYWDKDIEDKEILQFKR